MNRWVQTLLVFMGLCLLAAGLFLRPLEEKRSGRIGSKIYSKKVAAGIRVRSGGYPQKEYVYFSDCTVEKQKIGGFSLGGLNQLVISGLVVTLHEEQFREEKETADGGAINNAPKPPRKEASLEKIFSEPSRTDVFENIREFLGGDLRFSKVLINGLTVYLCKENADRVLFLKADHAVSARESFQFENGVFLLENGTYKTSKKARLKFRSPKIINTEERIIDLQKVLSREINF